ncbi:MAG TPA: TolC family protein [Bacillota bacterium]|nr:TolC family protein [Bacillota bacterium]
MRTFAIIVCCICAIGVCAAPADAEVSPGNSPSVWSIDEFAEAALSESRSYLAARESVETAEISERLAIPFYGFGVTLSSVRTGSIGSANSPGPSSESKDGERVSVRAPITDKLSLTANYAIDKSSCTLKLSYTPLSGMTGSDVIRQFPSWLLGSSGPTDAAISAVELAALKLDDARSAALLDARKAYISALKTIKARDIAREEHRLAGLELAIAEKRFGLGLSSELEVEQAKINLLDAELALMKAETDDRWMRKRLSAMTGQDMSSAILEGLPDFDLTAPDLEALVSAAVGRDADLAQAKAELATAVRTLESAKSLLPSVQVDAETTVGDWSPRFTVSANWSISLSRSGEIQKAAIRVEQRQRALDEATTAVTEAVAKNLDYLTIEVASMEKWRRQLEESEESHRKALESYEEGEVLLVDLERARLNLQKARNNYLAHWGAVWEMWYTLVDMSMHE